MGLCCGVILMAIEFLHHLSTRPSISSKEEFEVSYAPTFTKKLQNQEAVVGGIAKFVVKAIGEPSPTCKW
jgi:hypothetical protein